MKTNSGDYDFLKEIVSNLCGIVYILDLETLEYTWGNSRYPEILGYSEDEVYLNSLEFANKFFHPDDKHIVRERIEYFKDSKNTEWIGVYRIRHKKGHWIWMFSKVRVFKWDVDGKPKLLLGEVMDAFENIDSVRNIMSKLKHRIKSSNSDIIGKLTDREIEITYHIAIGKNYKEIAEKLHISPETVNKHRKNVFQKLRVNNIAALSTFAHENGLV